MCSFDFYPQISEALGVPLNVTDESTLAEMIEVGLLKIITKLEEVSVSGSREFTLEKNLAKMKEEWEDIVFVLSLFR